MKDYKGMGYYEQGLQVQVRTQLVYHLKVCRGHHKSRGTQFAPSLTYTQPFLTQRNQPHIPTPIPHLNRSFKRRSIYFQGFPLSQTDLFPLKIRETFIPMQTLTRTWCSCLYHLLLNFTANVWPSSKQK